jgi:hypothetical protein
MTINRTSIISGPALISFGGQKFWSKGDVVMRVINSRFNIETAHFGKVDERQIDRRVEISFEPSGRFDAALAAVLLPYGSTIVGASIFTGTDVPLTINGRDGRQIVVHAAAVTSMPSIRLAVDQTIWGSVTFTGICKNNTAASAAAAYYTESAVTYPGDADFDVADILTAPPVATWGASAPWSSFLSESGWTIDFDLQLAEQKVDGIGTVDMKFQSLAVTAKAIPVGPTAAELLTKLAPAVALGTSVASASDLVIGANGTGNAEVTLTNAALVDGGLAFGAQSKRLSECTWIATRTITAGVPDALFVVDAAT